MLAEGHGVHGSGKVRVVGNGDGDRIDLVRHLIEHLPIVREALGFGEIRGGFGAATVDVDIAEGYDIAFLSSVGGVGSAFSADSNAGNIQSSVVGAILVVIGSQDVWESDTTGDDGSSFEKRASVWGE